MPSKYTKLLLGPLVKNANSLAEVLRGLHLKPTGGNYRNIKQHIITNDISMEHFTGQGWARGKTALDNEIIARVKEKITVISDEEVFSEKSAARNRTVRARLLKKGRKYACVVEECPLFGEESPLWNGKKITLHLDHINGHKHDNREENLRFLCPNCHQQTKTWGNKIKS